MVNTLSISLCGLLFSLPSAILLALSINEVRNSRFKRTVQTDFYTPHVISIIVVCSMIRLFVAGNSTGPCLGLRRYGRYAQ